MLGEEEKTGALSINSFSGILITGGNYPGSLDTAEVLIPNLNEDFHSCSLPKMPEPKHGHMQFGTLVCGGPTAEYNGTCVE